MISAYVVQTGSTFWQGRIRDVELSWEENGMFLRYSSGNDIVAKYGEPWAPPQTPYHRTEQFRAETAVKLLLEMARNPKPRWADTALLAVETVDAIIAFLDTPQEYENEPDEWTSKAVATKAQLYRVHNQEVSK